MLPSFQQLQHEVNVHFVATQRFTDTQVVFSLEMQGSPPLVSCLENRRPEDSAMSTNYVYVCQQQPGNPKQSQESEPVIHNLASPGSFRFQYFSVTFWESLFVTFYRPTTK